MSEKSIFIIGPGSIGWNVLDLLIAQGYKVTGLVRRKEHGDQIAQSGASVVFGDLNDKALITEQTAKHDVTIHTATADHLPSAKAVLDGIRERAAQGLDTVYIHTSGASVLDDGSLNEYKGEKIFRDDRRERIDRVADDAPHREIDLAILKVKREVGHKVKIAIMMPPIIYGINPTHNRLSSPLPTITRFALKHGYVPLIGPGLGVESNIHVLDLARAYLIVLDHLFSSQRQQQQQQQSQLLDEEEEEENPYFFIEATGSNEPSWYEIASTIGSALHTAGRITDPAPKSLVGREQWGDLFGDFTGAILGLNSRSRAVRLRALGWEAREKDWKRSFGEDELPVLLEEDDVEGFEGYKMNVAS